MSMYDDVKVSLSLGDLSAILCAANCLEFTNEKCEALEKRNAEINSTTAEIVEEWKARLKEYTDANAELHRTIDTLKQEIERLKNRKPREVSPLLRKRIENAKDVLRQITPVVADCDGSFGEVAGDRFNSVYNTLQELYDVLRVEVQ